MLNFKNIEHPHRAFFARNIHLVDMELDFLALFTSKFEPHANMMLESDFALGVATFSVVVLFGKK